MNKKQIKKQQEERELEQMLPGFLVVVISLAAMLFLINFFCNTAISFIEQQEIIRHRNYMEKNFWQQLEKELDSGSKKPLLLEEQELTTDWSNVSMENNNALLTEKEFMILPDRDNIASVNNYAVSPDGKDFAFIIKKDGKEAVVLNGETGPFYQAITFLSFSPDSQHFAYGVKTAGSEAVVRDNKLGAMFDWVLAPYFYTPDSQYFVHKSKDIRGEFLVFNDTSSNVYDQIYTLFIDEDDKLGFYARRGDIIYKVSLELEDK